MRCCSMTTWCRWIDCTPLPWVASSCGYNGWMRPVHDVFWPLIIFTILKTWMWANPKAELQLKLQQRLTFPIRGFEAARTIMPQDGVDHIFGTIHQLK